MPVGCLFSRWTRVALVGSENPDVSGALAERQNVFSHVPCSSLMAQTQESGFYLLFSERRLADNLTPSAAFHPKWVQS